jgi:hypothetical protein
MIFYVYGYNLNSASYINAIITNNIFPVNFISGYQTKLDRSEVYNNLTKSTKGKLISPYIISFVMNNTITDYNQFFTFNLYETVNFPNYDSTIDQISVKKKLDKSFTDCTNQIVFAIKTNLRFILTKNQKEIEIAYSHFENFVELIFNPLCSLNKTITYTNEPSVNINSLSYSFDLTNTTNKFTINITANNTISQSITVK